MIKFINKDGNTFFGEPPYIHWFGDNNYSPNFVDSTKIVSKDIEYHTLVSGQSINLQYIKSVLIISDSPSLIFKTNKKGIFKLIDPAILAEITNPTPSADSTDSTDTITLSDLTKNPTIKIDGTQYSEGNLYLYQLLISASAQTPGQYTDTIIIEEEGGQSQKMTIGADFYDYDEIIGINLENRGTEIPETIQKAIYGSDIKEAFVDNILINRKFKELISNYLDIMDNRGSYKSLWNSLEWFEWGKNVNLLEIWKNEDGYFEKDLENILSEQYKSLFTTHQKTTYLALEAALHEYKTDNKGNVVLDDEKNPVLQDISHMWSNEVLGLKISLLGAFFERYFMPIHLALKNAVVQARVFTNMMKIHSWPMQSKHHWHDDWGVVDIKMPHIVTLGNIKPVSVGRNTVFGYQGVDLNETILERTDNDGYNITRLAGVTYLTGDSTQTPPVSGVELKDTGHAYDSTDSTELMTIWGNIRGHVGVVVPVNITIPLPEGDAISEETIVIYRYDLDKTPDTVPDTDRVRIFERRLWKAECINQAEWDEWEEEHEAWEEDGKVGPEPIEPKKRWAAVFSFNLLSIKEEKVTFSLQLHSLSGHTWTAASTYEAIDTSGFKLSAYRVSNKIFDNVFADSTDPTKTYWASWNPYEGQWNSITVDKYTPVDNKLEPQYYHGNIIKQYIPCGNLQKYLNELVVVKFDDELKANSFKSIVGDKYYIIERNPVDSSNNIIYLRMYIRKEGGEVTDDLFDEQTVLRRDYIFIPQLHEYTSLDSIPLRVNKYGHYIMDDYTVDPVKDLLCVIPEFKYSKKIDTNSISWIFENKTTHEKIEIGSKDNPGPQTQPFIANDYWSVLTPGYWSVTMTFNYIGEEYTNKITRNSLFLVQKEKMTN